MVRNLDTGEMIHVSEVGERVQKGIGPEAMHWLLHEEERAGRILIPFISSTVDILKCAPPLPLVSMLGTPESGASLRPVITLDRYRCVIVLAALCNTCPPPPPLSEHIINEHGGPCLHLHLFFGFITRCNFYMLLFYASLGYIMTASSTLSPYVLAMG
ncbi:hypothetical protein T492DRAFT_300923 [Pavlovales sp. CCMP2436]|nr:hypothetical protein T492DRAFT_300923 [Pavlovales sp. CCMP2436]